MDVYACSDDGFEQLCRQVVDGLGLGAAQPFEIRGASTAFSIAFERVSSDGLFRTKESWLSVFVRARAPLDSTELNLFTQAALTVGAGNLLLVSFGEVEARAAAELRAMLAREERVVVLLAGDLAQLLADDYGGGAPNGFSFAHLRTYLRSQGEQAP